MPTLTRAALDAILVGRNRAYLAAVSPAWSTAIDGTNPDTADAIAEGLSSLRLAAATFGTVVDADLAGVAPTAYAQLVDIADLRLKRSLLDALATTLFDQSIGDKSQSLGQVRDTLETSIAALEARVMMLYGYGRGRISAGNLDLGFAATDPTQTTPLWPRDY